MYSIFIVAMTDQTFTTPKDAIKLLEHYQQEKATALDMYKQKMNLLRDHATTLAMQPTKRKRQQATWELLLKVKTILARITTFQKSYEKNQQYCFLSFKLVNDYTIEQQNQEDTLKRLADNNKDLWSELNHLYERFTPLVSASLFVNPLPSKIWFKIQQSFFLLEFRKSLEIISSPVTSRFFKWSTRIKEKF